MLVLRNILCNAFLVMHLYCTILRATECAPSALYSYFFMGLYMPFFSVWHGYVAFFLLGLDMPHLGWYSARITTLGFCYSQLTDETAAYRVICCLLYRFISNAIKARAVHCFHNSIPVTTALEEYAISHQDPSSSVAQPLWGGPWNELEGQWRRKISVQVKLPFFHACWLLIFFIASFRPPTPQSPLYMHSSCSTKYFPSFSCGMVYK